MRFALLTALSALAALVVADVEFTTPAAGAILTAGSTISIKWDDSGDAPKISALTSYQLFLCAGGNDDTSYIQLSALIPNGLFSTGNAATAPISTGLGASVANAYFLKMISVATEGGTMINFSDRFSISGMTGTFPAAVTTGLESVTGTDGPAKVDDVSTGVATSAAAVDGGEYTVAYHLQTGLTKYAPMQPVPPTKITASNPTPLNPTSAYTIATTYLGKATILTTMTASQTYSVSSIENTVAAASQPTGDMKKFLNRWKD